MRPFAPLLLCLTLLPAAAAPPAGDALDREPALAALVDLQVKEEPFCDLLPRLEKLTGVPLAASEDTANERATVFARQRPARELLRRLAAHFDYRWVVETRRGKRTLVLIQDAAAKQRERALRNGPERDIAAICDMFEERLRQAATPQAQELARQPLEKRLSRLKEIDERLNGRIVKQPTMSPDGTPGYRFDRVPFGRPLGADEKARLQREAEALKVVTPTRDQFYAHDAAYHLYAAMPPSLRERFRAGESVPFAFPPEPGRLAIAERTAVDVASGGIGNLAKVEQPDGPDIPLGFNALEALRGELSWQRRGMETRLDLRVRALASYNPNAPTRVERVFKEDIWAPYRYNPSTQPRLDRGAQALTELVTVSDGRKEDPKDGAMQGELLELLSRTTRYPIIADAYIAVQLGFAYEQRNKPLSNVLDSLCRLFESTCRFEGGYLLIRHQRWADKRAAQPPARRMKQWEAAYRPHGAFPLATTVEIANRLSPEQAEALIAWWTGRGPIAGGPLSLLEADLEQSATALRLLNQLSPAMRRALDGGSTISFRLLAPRALVLARDVVLESARSVETVYDFEQEEGARRVGDGLAAERRAEAAFLQGTVSLERKPTECIFTRDRSFLQGELQEALQWERIENPKATEKDLARVPGGLVKVTFRVPSVPPVVHWFFDPAPREGKRP